MSGRVRAPGMRRRVVCMGHPRSSPGRRHARPDLSPLSVRALDARVGDGCRSESSCSEGVTPVPDGHRARSVRRTPRVRIEEDEGRCRARTGTRTSGPSSRCRGCAPEDRPILPHVGDVRTCASDLPCKVKRRTPARTRQLRRGRLWRRAWETRNSELRRSQWKLASANPTLRARAADAVRCRCSGHDPDRTARRHQGGRHPAQPARADPCGERSGAVQAAGSPCSGRCRRVRVNLRLEGDAAAMASPIHLLRVLL